MGTIHIRDLTGGLDVRRLPETTPGGVLVRGDNGHITRGGEFESRAAFVPEFVLPAGTFGLANTRSGLVVFGDAVQPAGFPSFVQYHRIQKAGKTLAGIRDWELFGGKIYAVAEYTDGSVVHFYDGVEVPAWQEARASAVVQVVSGAIQEAQAAAATFSVTGGLGEIIHQLRSLKVDGTELLAAPVTHTGNNATTAAAIAAAVNANPTAPKYIATAAGAAVTLETARAGAYANGRAITVEMTGLFAVSALPVFSGGSNIVYPTVNSLTVGGVEILRGPVEWPGSVQAMADAIADAIADLSTNPEYEAHADGDRVIVKSTVAGDEQNGLTVTAATSGDLVLAYPSGTTTTGGVDLDAGSFLPADVILTVRERIYGGGGSILHYSAIQSATHWAAGGTGAGQIGAGFTNIASSNASSYRITSLVRYFDKLAVFTADTVQTWFLDPDPNLINQTQVLENTGTECPRSVTQFGDADIFYLDASGLRSLRARDSSNAAATTDIGVPIDDILAARVSTMTETQKRNVIGLINPTDKRFWLILGNEIYVYSYFPQSKVNAWTRYEASLTTDLGPVEMDITDAVTFDRRVFLRAGDTIYCYGGWGKTPRYDATRAHAWLPMLDANVPAAEKDWRGIDAAVKGGWDVAVATDPNRPDAQQETAHLSQTTYGLRRIPVKDRSTHLGVRFTSRGGHAVLSSVVIHFDGKVNED